jgi:hypothetical protein
MRRLSLRRWRCRTRGYSRCPGSFDCRSIRRRRSRNRCWRRSRKSSRNRRLYIRDRRCLDWCFCHWFSCRATTTLRGSFAACSWLGLRVGQGSRGRGPAPPTSRSRRSGNTCALLALPASADAGNLIVTQRTQMAAHRYVHLTKEIDYLVAWNPELACQIMYSKLAQPYSSPSVRPPGIGVGLSARIPFARPLSTIPTTAVVSRPTADPNSAAGGPTNTATPRA